MVTWSETPEQVASKPKVPDPEASEALELRAIEPET